MAHYYIINSDLFKQLLLLLTQYLYEDALVSGIEITSPKEERNLIGKLFIRSVTEYDMFIEEVDNETLIETLSNFIDECTLLNLNISTITLIPPQNIAAALIKETHYAHRHHIHKIRNRPAH